MENQLNDRNNFMSSIDTSKTHTIRSKSDNIETIIGNETNETIQELFGCFQKDIQQAKYKIQQKDANLFLILLIYCIINTIKWA